MPSSLTPLGAQQEGRPTTGDVAFRILGPVEVVVRGRAAPISSAKRRSMLVTLLLAANEVVSVDRLVGSIWDEPPRSAVANVRSYASDLRALLGRSGEPRLTGVRSGYRLRIEPDELDLQIFDLLAAQARAAIARGDHAVAASALGRASDLWRGAAAADIPRTSALLPRLAALDERRRSVLDDYIDVQLRLGAHDAVIPRLRQLVAAEPLRERNWCQLMLALYRQGDPAAALGAFVDARRALAEGLGLDPGAELCGLHQAILRRDPALTPVSAPARRITDDRRVPRQLPPDITTFVGRTDELAQMTTWLTCPRANCTVIAIHGSGGTGKSALATRFAHSHAARFPDGQLYVDLRGATPGMQPLPPNQVLAAFLSELGVPSAEIPADAGQAAARLRSELARKQVLLVLDNAEDGTQVRPLLPTGTRCAALITSRRMLAVLDDVHQLELRGLSVEEAVTMLGRVTSAERVGANRAAAVDLVNRCGRLPLAVRIAGARLATRPDWTIETLAERLAHEHERLDELDAEDLDLRSCFRIGYRPLADGEQPGDVTAASAFRLLGAIGVPAVSVPVAAALLDTDPFRAESTLDRLVEVRLLDPAGGGRYRMHDLLRLYARELAEQREVPSDRDAAVLRALVRYLDAARRARDLIRPNKLRPDDTFVDPAGPAVIPLADRPAALEWFGAELSNLLVAAERAAAGPPHLALFTARLAPELYPYMPMQGYRLEWQALGELALRAAEQVGTPSDVAATLVAVGGAYQRIDRTSDAISCMKRALSIRRETGDTAGAAVCLDHLGIAYSVPPGERLDLSLQCFAESLTLHRQRVDRSATAITLNNTADVYLSLGRYDEALAALTESLAIRRSQGDPLGEGVTLTTLGSVYAGQREHDEALRHLTDAVVVCRDTGNRESELTALIGRADVHLGAGRITAATADYECALDLSRQVGDAAQEAAVLARLAELSRSGAIRS